MEVIDDIGRDMPGRIAEIPCGVEFGDGAAEAGVADKDVGIEIKRYIGKQRVFDGIEILENSRTKKIFRGKTIIDIEDIVIMGGSCGSGQSAIAEIRLEGVLETDVRFGEVCIQVKAEIPDRLPYAVMMGVVRIENADKSCRRGKIDRA